MIIDDLKNTLLYISTLALLVFSCNNPDSPDCIKTTGETKEYTIELADTFDRLLINSNVDVFITDAEEQSVVLVTGENIFKEMSITVINQELIFQNNNSCNWAREYGTTSLRISTPDLKEIYYEGGATIRSTNTLTFSTLSLNSLESSGDYVLDIESEELNITTKRISNFYITGRVVDLNLDFQTGDGRFNGEGLIAQNVRFYHNGTNDIKVFPVQILEGIIDRYGNLIYYNDPINPPQVETFSKGRLIEQF